MAKSGWSWGIHVHLEARSRVVKSVLQVGSENSDMVELLSRACVPMIRGGARARESIPVKRRLVPTASKQASKQAKADTVMAN